MVDKNTVILQLENDDWFQIIVSSKCLMEVEEDNVYPLEVSNLK